jgi:hypothetical protein
MSLSPDRGASPGDGRNALGVTRWVRLSGHTLGDLWPAAAAVIPVVVLYLWHPVAGKDGDLLQYVAQGTLVPLLLLVWLLLERRCGAARVFRVRAVLGAVAACSAFALVIWRFSPSIVILALLQVILTFAILRRSVLPGAKRFQTLMTVLLLVASWTASLTLVWWGPSPSSPIQLINGSVPAGMSLLSWIGPLVVIVVAVLLAIKKVFAEQSAHAEPPWLPALLAAAIFAYASLQTFGLADPGITTGWAFYVGPAELVRHGGWLLWDVPSQYGFLSVLAVAWLPLQSAWESLYALNAAATLGLALIVYWALRSPRAGVLDWAASVLITLAAVFLRAGLSASFAGPPMFPSTGGYRFVFCVALLAVLLRIARGADGRVLARWLVAGTVLWLVSLLWAAEAAAYATAIWIPAYLLLIWRVSRQAPRWRKLLVVAPFLALACLFGVLVAIYELGVGHPPDLHLYLEYATTYAGGFGALIADPAGPALLLLLCLAILGTLAVRSVQRAGPTHARSAYLIGAFFAVWATSSYFASRSHPNNAVNLAPVYVVALMGALRLTSGEGFQRARMVLRTVLVPVLASVLIGAFGYLHAIPTFIQNPPASVLSVQSDFWSDAQLSAFMRSADIGPGAPVTLLDEPGLSQLPPGGGQGPNYWLPIAPYGEIDLLAADNRTVYLQRFMARGHASGWLIVENVQAGESHWVAQEVSEWCTATRVIRDADWTATYYQCGGSAS